jgi:hypothetical protein
MLILLTQLAVLQETQVLQVQEAKTQQAHRTIQQAHQGIQLPVTLLKMPATQISVTQTKDSL